MAAALVWLVAAFVFFVLRVAAPGIAFTRYIFVLAIPVTFVVTTVFTALWYPLWARFLSVSALIWTIAMALDVCVRIDNMYLIYIVAAIIQVLAALWYLFIAAPKLACRAGRRGRMPKKRIRKDTDAANDAAAAKPLTEAPADKQ